VRTVANQGAIAIENAEAFRGETLKAADEEELSIARDLQMSMPASRVSFTRRGLASLLSQSRQRKSGEIFMTSSRWERQNWFCHRRCDREERSQVPW